MSLGNSLGLSRHTTTVAGPCDVTEAPVRRNPTEAPVRRNPSRRPMGLRPNMMRLVKTRPRVGDSEQPGADISNNVTATTGYHSRLPLWWLACAELCIFVTSLLTTGSRGGLGSGWLTGDGCGIMVLVGPLSRP